MNPEESPDNHGKNGRFLYRDDRNERKKEKFP